MLSVHGYSSGLRLALNLQTSRPLYKRSMYLPSHSYDVYGLQTWARIKRTVGSYSMLWSPSYCTAVNRKGKPLHRSDIHSNYYSSYPQSWTHSPWWSWVQSRSLEIGSCRRQELPLPPANWFGISIKMPDIVHSLSKTLARNKNKKEIAFM
jgi:hypothetical protein